MTKNEPHPMVQLRRLARQASISSSPIKNTVQEEKLEGLFPGYSASGQDVWLTPDQATFNGSGIVVSAVGARCGKSFLAHGQWGVTANTAVLLPQKNVSAHFLWYLLNDETFWIKGQTAQPYVQLGPSMALPVPAPSPQQQVQIVRFLDRETAKIDALIGKQEQLIATLREDRAATITHAVTKGIDANAEMKKSGAPWIGDIPSTWRLLPLKSAIEYQEGPGIMAADFRDDGIPLLRVSSVRNRFATLEGCNFLDPEKVAKTWAKFQVREGDLLISASASMGTVSEVGSGVVGAIPYTGIIRVITRPGTLRDFIRWFFESGALRTQTDLLKTGSTIQHFGPTHLSQMHVALPPTSVQQLIADYLDNHCSKVDSLIDKSTEMIETLREYRSALITNAVTGKIDVREMV